MLLFILLLKILLLLSPSHGFPTINKEPLFLDIEALKELDAFELRMLKDFVRGKGRGSVSRLAFEDLFKESDDPIGVSSTPDPSDQEIVSFYGDFMKSEGSSQSPFIIPNMPSPALIPTAHAVHPSSKPLPERTRDGPKNPSASIEPVTPFGVRIRPKPQIDAEADPDAFRELANLFQQFIDRRKPVDIPTTTTTTTTTAATSTQLVTQPSRRIIRKQTFPASLQFQIPSATSSLRRSQPNWQFMDPSETNNADKDYDDDWEKKMQDLSHQLTTILKQIKETKQRPKKTVPQKPKPRITVVRNGSAEQLPDNYYKFVATITLIQDSGKNILVDTGLGTDINARTELMKTLGSMQVVPPAVDYVVTTHGHPDHAGNTADFPDALHFQGCFSHQRNVFNLSRLFETKRQQLTDNVYIIKTPGHTSEDISVIVQNAEFYGNVSVTGDIFMRMDDTDNPMMWRPLSFNESEQATSRRYLLCTSDYLIPGHGPLFKVSAHMKEKYGC